MSIWEACLPLVLLAAGGALVLLAVIARRKARERRQGREELLRDPLAEIFCDKEEL